MVKRLSLTIVEIFSFSRELVEDLSCLSIKRKQKHQQLHFLEWPLEANPEEPTLEFPT